MLDEKEISYESEKYIISTFNLINNLIYSEDYDQAKSELCKLHHADLADYLDRNSFELNKIIVPKIADIINPETIIWLSPRTKNSLAKILDYNKFAQYINQLDIEDAIDVVEEIEQSIRPEIIGAMDEEKRQHIIEGFTYPEHTVGRVMEKRFVSFLEHWTVGQAIDFLRKENNLTPDIFHAAIIVDTKLRPKGYVILSTLLKHSRSTHLKSIMSKNYKVSDTNTSLDQLTYIFKQYALTIVPVINKIGKLVGTVSINNIVYIIEEQAEEDILNMAGVNEIDLYQSLAETAKQRFPWLFINLLTAFLTSLIIDNFRDTIEKIVALAAIMPIVASMGGNAGTQTMTVTVRAIANKDITKTNVFKIILKEILSCALNGMVLATIGGLILLIIFADTQLSMVFGCAVILNFVIAGTFGSSIPILLNSIDLDPAPASGVVLTTITDSFGFFIFLILAKFLIAQ